MLPDLERAEKKIIKFNQRIAEEIDSLENSISVKKSSVLVKLDPILAQGLLCVGGRLGRAALPENSKHQTVIPKNSHLARLIVYHFHEKSAHSGREYVLSLRERFWQIRAHSVIRSVLSSCFACKRRHAPPGVQKMADLPARQITPDKPPFTCVGIGDFGPFLIHHQRLIMVVYEKGLLDLQVMSSNLCRSFFSQVPKETINFLPDCRFV